MLGKGGQTLKWIGQKAREELTEILDRPVHLFLHVKVKAELGRGPRLLPRRGLDFDV